ncbi:bifunctional tetrahydrofolate synthase/dihydrofolate synthase [Corallincola spongiicola]|uniref:Dihydrofolate synthase/folylpolyglutamate synthase n=1 Tax=Corallincola spongiicola TaxID=2520508 RepID=A0ABY1WML4_9GAMM|nr:bifunctional tetrahydrofolate synthase/dihydrofolate synthase [Corallincola spongiicola]TAA42718.1 bifunctional tetrahydrofolate synthase/dihydrofolate synthase [Corallincola spongiicola]
MQNERFESQSLEDWLCYLEKLHPAEIEMGLERVSKLAARLSLIKPAPTVLLVGGTNGKGSTVALLENLCLVQGLTTGIYSSPHLRHYNERVRINGKELEDSQHSQAFAAVEAARGDIALTYFEFGTLAALWLIAQADVDVALLEVGLGGRLDATNIVDADASVITSVDLDHQSFLGNTRESVGFEKAGIFRANKPAIIGEPDVPPTMLEQSRLKQAIPAFVGEDFHYKKRQDSWYWQTEGKLLERLPLPNIPLANAATALMTLHQLKLMPDIELVKQVLINTVLPGRFQVISQQPTVVLDVGHNPHAANYLNKRLQALKGDGKVIAVVAMLADKDIAATLSVMLPTVDQWLVASLDVPRGATSDLLEDKLAELGSSSDRFEQVKDAYDHALAHASAGDVVIVFGSFYTVAEISA